MKPARIIFEKRYNTGNYEHENLTVEYVFEEGDKITAAEGLLKARQDVVQASTAYLKAIQGKKLAEAKRDAMQKAEADKK